MTSEQTKQDQQICQLTDYREDWPEGKKGVLFYVHAKNALFLLDCPWRKGANWDDFPKLFPYEEELINDTSNQILYGYGAFLLQSWHRKMPLIKDSEIIDQNEIGEYLNLPDLDTLQEHYYQQDFWQMEATWGKALCSNVLHDQIDCSEFIMRWQDDIYVLRQIELQRITPQQKLFGNYACIKLPKTRDIEYQISVDDGKFDSRKSRVLQTYYVEDLYSYLSNENKCQPILYQSYDRVIRCIESPIGKILDNRTEKLDGIAYGFAAAFTNYCVFEYYFRFKGFLHPDFFKDFPNECLVDPQQLTFETNLQEAFTTYFTHQINELEKELSKHDVDYFSLESDEDKHYYLIAQLLHMELSYRNQNETLYAVLKNEDTLRKHVDEFLKFVYTKLQKAEGFNDIKSEYQSLFSKTKPKEQKACTDIPKENHYADTARWIEKHKSERDYMREANNNVEEMARILSPIFGWVLEGHQLRKALNRR